MKDLWSRLVLLAHDQVSSTIRSLPEDLRPHAEQLAVLFERVPSEAIVDGILESDLLGLFVGDSLGVSSADSGPLPRQILLFLENLWDFAEGDEEIFREEVQITFIHEFGHYLGLEEHELEERGLL
ncbi:MAG: metallopeptidase family protein [Pedosphaera sp.]|nr:metallopeptidase family protein [Pedosphaera sp.]